MGREHENCQEFYRIARRGDDLGPLADLWTASWQAAMPQIDFAARRDWFLAHVVEIEQAGGATYCAYDVDNRLAGFVLIDVACGVLEQIAILPAYFGGGLGALLLDHAKALCGQGLRLDVNVDNPRALRFYQKHGFVKSGEGINPRSGLPIWQMRWAPA